MHLQLIDWVIVLATLFICFFPALFFGKRAGQNQVALFDRAGENVTVRNEGPDPLGFLLIAGEPIGTWVSSVAIPSAACSVTASASMSGCSSVKRSSRS